VKIKKMNSKKKLNFGFGLLELIVAMGLFMIVIVSGGGVLKSYSLNRLADEEIEATLYTTEGLDAVRSIANQNWSNLTAGTYGLDSGGGIWDFLGSSNTSGPFTRQVVISDVYRDGLGNVVEVGGTLDADTYKVISTTSWDFSPTRNNSVSSVNYLTNFKKVTSSDSEANNLIVNISTAAIGTGGSNDELQGITLQNIGPSSITIAKITVEWVTNTGNLIEEVRIDGTRYWRYKNNVGTPTGRQPSGTLLDMNDFILTSAAGVVPIDRFRFDNDMSTETQFTLTFEMIDGSTKVVVIDLTGGGCGATQADDLTINIAGAAIGVGGDDDELQGITLQNVSTAPGCDVTITHATVTWTGSNLIEEVRIDGTRYWRYKNNVGTPTGRQPSGTLLDMVDFVLTSAAGVVPIDRFRFDNNMSAVTQFTLTLTMIDGSTKTVVIDLTGGGGGGGGGGCGATQADDLTINVAGAAIGAGNDSDELQGITLQNISTASGCDVTLTHATVTWTGAQLIEEVRIDGTRYWRYKKNVGTPVGRQPSGTLLDMVDFVLTSADGVVPIDRFRFDTDMTGDTFGITFTLGDGSTKTVGGIAL
jgi:type II secretory pathway pseudopilin PulG